jgi:hypothetical protein
MKIKVIVIMALLSTAAVSGAYGFGIGAQFNFSAGSIFAPGAALLISPSDRTNLAVNWFINKDSDSIIGFTFDAVPLSLPFVKGDAATFKFNLGVGLYVNATFSEKFSINSGLRIPVGFSLLLGKEVFEIFTHIAPSFGVDFLPSLGLGEPFYPIALGARIWFR